MKLLYLDCFSGISGDMTLGALLDLGLPFDELRRALGSLLTDGWEIGVERVVRGGIAASKFKLFEPRRGSATTQTSEGRSGDHGHRTLVEITRLIEQSALSAEGRRRATMLFRRLAEVEAGIHQTPVEQVHLHEVGAVDSIVDIVGAVFAFEWLAPDRVVVSPLNVGRGTVRMAHGVLPVPAPATAQILQGVPIYAAGPEMEMVTPTGALIATAYAHQFGPLPAMRVERIGYGAGDRNPDGQPNVMRAMLGTADAAANVERVLVIECEIDDMNPQIFGVVMDRLLAAGALDVYYAPVQMKKNRPATLVTVIARPADRDALAGILFRETTTIGLRYQELDRERLDRESVSVETPAGAVRMKIARRGGVVMNAAPEFDDCVRLARDRQMAVKDVQALAMKAWLDTKD